MTAAFVAALALLLSALIPQGYMPARGADGAITIAICAPGLSPAEHARVQAEAQARFEAALGEDHRGDGDKDEPNTHCPFGVLAAPALASLAPKLDVPQVARKALPSILTTTMAIGRGLAAPPPPSTGPPRLS
ncbi:hypothetical protein [Qipengyuania qiaonensis]|uniref:DUF2946 domain-containing protein n=1 Tax=Qipengyuania qiaonensis TaxID=2867240 RepID=A0ABS7J2Z0_9SPHN|nr:hypothetical protein [Qipengyuania qiaonensis]MBX7481691.1 hypothetical protein [Qipengyuania qiaonensis]